MRLPAFVALAAMATLSLSQPAAALAASFAPAPAQRQQERIEGRVQLLVLHATNQGKGIDKRIGDMPQLKEPPFSSYDTYSLLQDETKAFGGGGPLGMLLKATKGKLVVRVKSKTGKRYGVEAEVLNADESRFVSAQMQATENEWFFIAGPKHDKGILVLVLRVLPK